MKRVLVIGGSYFVGRVFVEELSREPQHEIVVLNRGTHPLRIEGVEEIVCDRNDSQRLGACLDGRKWDCVVDFCAYTPRDIRNLMLGLTDGSVKQYIYLSTTSVYAPTKSLPVTEDAPKLSGPQPEYGPAATYGFQKWLAEKAVATYAKKLGIASTCLRPAIIYGKYNYAPRERYFFEEVLADRRLVLPDNDLALFQFVSVWDVATIIRLCLDNPVTFGDAYNLSADELVSYGRFVEVLESVMGRRIPTRKVPVDVIEQERIPLPFPLDTHLIYSGARIKEILGFRYTPLREGMRKTYAWYLEKQRSSA